MPSHAQDDPPIGSRLGKRQDIVVQQDPRAAAQAAHRFAGCVYVQRPAGVRAALDSLDPDESRRLLDKVEGKGGTCINLMIGTDAAYGQKMSLPPELYRGLLAEAALRQDLKSVALEAVTRQPSYQRGWFAVTGRPLAVDEMGACVADVNPAGVRALLATTAETPEEKRAVSELAASLGPCLTVGAKLSANRQSLRAALAEALYHRAVAEKAADQVAK